MEKLPAINSRVKEVIQTFDGGKVAQFAKRLENVSQQRLNRIFNIDKRTNKYPAVPDDVLIDIAKALPEVDLRWLLTGKGEKQSILAPAQSDDTVYKGLYEEALEEITGLKKQIATLKFTMKESERMMKEKAELLIAQNRELKAEQQKRGKTGKGVGMTG